MKTRKITNLGMAVLIIFALTSFANIFELTIGENIGFAGLSTIIGVIFFFIIKKVEKQPFEGSGFSIHAIPANLTNKVNVFWMLTPLMWNLVALAVENFMPSAKEHILDRAAALITYDTKLMTILMLFILALGEEIAWRAFFQNHLQRIMNVPWAIIITSGLFALSHYAAGNLFDVSFDMVSVFVSSVLYGIVFHKTRNAWISGFAHFLSNIMALIFYGVL